MLHKPKLGFVAYMVLLAVFCLVLLYTLRLDDNFSVVPENANQRIYREEKEQEREQEEESPDTSKFAPHEQPTLSEMKGRDEQREADEYYPRSTEALRSLRSIMKNNAYVPESLDAYIILYQDVHQNDEFLADKDHRLEFLSGFTGENGTIIVTEEHAYLLTDYESGSDAHLDENWTVQIEGNPNVPTSLENWLSTMLAKAAKIGFHSFTMPYRQWEVLNNATREREQTLVPIDENLVDLIRTNETIVSSNPLITLELYFSGETGQSKIGRLRSHMLGKGATICLVQSLEEVAWLLNLRGSDIPYIPVFFSYLLVSTTAIHLFIDEGKITPTVAEHFKKENLNINIHKYEDALPIFVDILNSESAVENKVWLAGDTSYAFVAQVATSKLLLEDLPIAFMKAIKNEVEIDGSVNAHVKDAVAFCCFFAWLEKQMGMEKSNVTELTAAKQLEKYRRQQPNYLNESFPTISASGPHASSIHYRVTPETDRLLSTDEIYLCDSGAHYKDGTTDVTRTVHFGKPTDYEKECFTRVLKGHIQMRTSVFPENTRGNVLDAFARRYLWDAGLEYHHGTGHGIGAVLNVHESPISISEWVYPGATGMHENMLLTNEPGYYEDGKFGVRIENVLRTVRKTTKYSKTYKKFLSFEDLTLIPIQTSRLLTTALLTKDEIQYINEYHAQCREKVAPLLQAEGETDGLAWLLKETKPI